jgi:hypothetical protein
MTYVVVLEPPEPEPEPELGELVADGVLPEVVDTGRAAST